MKSFEDRLKRLEELSEKLERGQVSLEEAVSLFEEGIRLAKDLATRLNEAESRIEQLLQAADGKERVAPLDIREDEK